MEEKNEQQVEKAKNFIESLLNKDNIATVLKDFFISNAANNDYFFKALSLVVKEESNRVISSNQQDHESHLIYIKVLESHLLFLQKLLVSNNNIDENEIEKKILKILEEMKEERNKQRDAKKEQQVEERREQTKRLAMTAILAGAGGIVLAMLMNTGNGGKSGEQTAKIMEHFLDINTFK